MNWSTTRFCSDLANLNLEWAVVASSRIFIESSLMRIQSSTQSHS